MEEHVEEVITFDYIREAYLAEKSENKLTKLPKEFFEKARKYLQLKEEIYKNTGDEKIKYELKSAKKMIDDILLLRLKKIIEAVFIFLKNGALPENLLKEEEEFFFSLIDLVKNLRKSLLEELKEKETSSKKEKEEKEIKKSETTEEIKEESKKTARKTRIKILFDIPQFVGPNGLTYGPFKRGEIIEIDEEIVSFLVDNGFAVKEM